MELWFTIVLVLSIAAFLHSILSHFSNKHHHLPPGPPAIPFIGNLLWLRNSLSDLESIILRLRPRYGHILSLRIGRRPMIFVFNHSLAHRALIQHGAIFSDRPDPPPFRRQRAINSSAYGPLWRLLRRNLTHEILHTSRVRGYSGSRRSVLFLLVRRLQETALSESSVRLIDHFQYAMFCLLALMCLGDKLQESQIKEIERVQRRILLGFRRFSVLSYWPRIGKFLMRKRWKELMELRNDQDKVLIPLIRARLQSKQAKKQSSDKLGDETVAYVDTLAELEIPGENGMLHEDEMVNLCSEFLSAGTDTTSTSLQWIMANLVKQPVLQDKVYKEIAGIKGRSPKDEGDMVEEEDLEKMAYLKAVVLEGLRLHPPGHFVLPHRVMHDVELDGYVIPRNAVVNFTVAEMGRDPNVWEDPMEYRPERFVGEAFDITGSREIKMMPFGAGRRICPGLGLALLHLEYFVANLIWRFEWKAIEGDEIDLSEKSEFTIVMKNPLCARISPRV